MQGFVCLKEAGLVLKNKGLGKCSSSNQCDRCEGDCNDDAGCKGTLKCFQRKAWEPVPGCLTEGGGGKWKGDIKGYDYCYGCSKDRPCGLCEDNCHSDDECDKHLK